MEYLTLEKIVSAKCGSGKQRHLVVRLEFLNFLLIIYKYVFNVVCVYKDTLYNITEIWPKPSLFDFGLVLYKDRLEKISKESFFLKIIDESPFSRKTWQNWFLERQEIVWTKRDKIHVQIQWVRPMSSQIEIIFV